MGIVKLTVYFETPFWVGVFERWEEDRLSVSKVTFGAEPRDCEVYEWLLAHYDGLRFGPSIPSKEKPIPANPKRMQRKIKRQLQDCGGGTKAQQALKLQQEQNQEERKARTRAEKEDEAQRRFEKKQQKKKAKHRGR